MEDVKRFEINGREFAFLCDSYSTRNGFAHRAKMFENWRKTGEAKRFYLNRTWECWDFQSVILDAISNAMSDVADDVKEDIKARNGWDKITAKRREAFTASLAENERYTLLKNLYEDVRKAHPSYAV